MNLKKLTNSQESLLKVIFVLQHTRISILPDMFGDANLNLKPRPPILRSRLMKTNGRLIAVKL